MGFYDDIALVKRLFPLMSRMASPWKKDDSGWFRTTVGGRGNKSGAIASLWRRGLDRPT